MHACTGNDAAGNSRFLWSPGIRLEPLLEQATAVESPPQADHRVARQLSCQARNTAETPCRFHAGVVPNSHATGSCLQKYLPLDMALDGRSCQGSAQLLRPFLQCSSTGLKDSDAYNVLFHDLFVDRGTRVATDNQSADYDIQLPPHASHNRGAAIQTQVIGICSAPLWQILCSSLKHLFAKLGACTLPYSRCL
jgi:hypothetical protein